MKSVAFLSETAFVAPRLTFEGDCVGRFYVLSGLILAKMYEVTAGT